MSVIKRTLISAQVGHPLSKRLIEKVKQASCTCDWQPPERKTLGSSLLGAQHNLKAAGSGSCVSLSTWAERRGLVRGLRRRALRCAPNAPTDSLCHRVCEPKAHTCLLVRMRADWRESCVRILSDT